MMVEDIHQKTQSVKDEIQVKHSVKACEVLFGGSS